MTEADWLACQDPPPMLDWLLGRLSGTRVLRMWVGACRAAANPMRAWIFDMEEEENEHCVRICAKGWAGGTYYREACPLPLRADLLRDVAGNPFLPQQSLAVGLPPEVMALAWAAYEDRDFALLPVLADALEEAGVAPHTPLLDHLRSPGPHVRGCWALDLVLGKR